MYFRPGYPSQYYPRRGGRVQLYTHLSTPVVINSAPQVSASPLRAQQSDPVADIPEQQNLANRSESEPPGVDRERKQFSGMSEEGETLRYSLEY